MSGLKDPSLPKNVVNGFNVGECYSSVPVELILIMPNIGYGFLANMYGTTRYDGKVQITPTPNGIFIDPLEYKDNSAFKYDAKGTRVFTPRTGYSDSLIVTSIPLNQPCQGEGIPRRNLELPIPLKIQLTISENESDSSWTDSVQAQHTGYASLWTANQVAESLSSKPTDLEYMYAGIALEVLRCIDARDTEERTDRWTGESTDSTRRIEYPDLTVIGETPEEIIANGFTDAEDAYGKAFTAPCVLIAIQGENGSRLYYSSQLNDIIMRMFQISGSLEPPKSTSKLIPYPVGAPSDLLPSTVPQGSTEYDHVVTALTPIEYELLTQRKGPHNISGLRNLRPITELHQIVQGTLETKSANLYTQFPPFISNYDMIGRYSDTRGFETLTMFDKTQFVKPLVSYTDSHAEYTKCYCDSGKVGIDYCFRCNGSGRIVCPDCNEFFGKGIKIDVEGGDKPGYFISEDGTYSFCETCNENGSGDYPGYIECPDCNGTGNGDTETCPVCGGDGLSYKSLPAGQDHPIEVKVEVSSDEDDNLTSSYISNKVITIAIKDPDMDGLLAEDISIFYGGTFIPRTVTSLDGTTQTVWTIDASGKIISMRRGAIHGENIPVLSKFKVYYVIMGLDDTDDTGFKYFSDISEAPIVSTLGLTDIDDAFYMRVNMDGVDEIAAFRKNEGFDNLEKGAAFYEKIMRRVIGLQSNPDIVTKEFAVATLDILTDDRIATDKTKLFSVSPDTLELIDLDNLDEVETYDGIMIGPESDYAQVFTGFDSVYPLISYAEFIKLESSNGVSQFAQKGISVDTKQNSAPNVVDLVGNSHLTRYSSSDDYGAVSMRSIIDNAITLEVSDPSDSIAACARLYSAAKDLASDLKTFIEGFALAYSDDSKEFGDIDLIKDYIPSPDDYYSIVQMAKGTSALTSSVCDIGDRITTITNIFAGEGESGKTLESLYQKMTNAVSDESKTISLIREFREKGESELLRLRQYISSIVDGTLGSNGTSETYIYVQSTNDDNWYLMTIPDSYGISSGFFFYNIRKLYTLIISIASYNMALIDRVIIRLAAIEKSFIPYWYPAVTEFTMGLGFALFESFNTPVYPEVDEGILGDGSADEIFESAEPGMFAISRLFKEGLFYYKYNINIPPLSIDTARGIALCGLGTGEEIAGLTAKDADFSLLETTESDFTDINNSFRDIQSVVGKRDFLKRSGGSVSFVNKAGVVETVTVPTDEDVGKAVAKGSGYNSAVWFNPQKIEGKIEVGKVFPYINDLSIDRSNIFDAQIEFQSAQPSSVVITYAGEGGLVTTTVDGNHINKPADTTDEILQDPVKAKNEAIRVATGIADALRDKIMLSKLYSIGESAGDTGAFDNSWLIPFVGSTDPTFTPTAVCDSSLISITLGGGDPTESEILGTGLWDSYTPGVANGVQKDMNYNLYLSKRRAAYIAQWVLYLLTGSSDVPSVNNGVIYGTGNYNVRIEVMVDSTTEPTLASGEYAFRAFRCYGFGSLFSVAGSKTKDAFAPDRSTSIKIYNPRSSGAFEMFSNTKGEEELLYQIPLGSEIVPDSPVPSEVLLGGDIINNVYMPTMQEGKVATYWGYNKEEEEVENSRILSIANYKTFNAGIDKPVVEDTIDTRITEIMKGRAVRKDVRSGIKKYLKSHIGNFVAENTSLGEEVSNALFSNVWVIISKDS